MLTPIKLFQGFIKFYLITSISVTVILLCDLPPLIVIIGDLNVACHLVQDAVVEYIVGAVVAGDGNKQWLTEQLW